MGFQKWTVTLVAISFFTLDQSCSVNAQSVTVDTRSAAESQNNVRVQGGGNGLNIETNSSAQSGSRTRVRDAGQGVQVETQTGAASQNNVRVQGGASGQSIEVDSGAAAGTQNRVRMDNGGAGTAINNRSGSAAQSNIGINSNSPSVPIMIPPQVETPNQGIMPPAAQASTPVLPPAAGVEMAPSASTNPSAPIAVKPVNCEKVEEVTIDEMNIKVVNKSCRGKIMSLQAWRENGKTKVQFIFDNKGFSNTTIKMSEIWYDRRGRAIEEKIDEQKFAVEANHNKAVLITGPVPQAMTAVINFYR